MAHLRSSLSADPNVWVSQQVLVEIVATLVVVVTGFARATGLLKLLDSRGLVTCVGCDS